MAAESAARDVHAVDSITTALGSAQSVSAVSSVATRMLDLFLSGDVTPGTRLPAERHLAESLGVGRSAVREALAALEILGIVSVRPGSGTYLRGTASELLPQTLRWGLLVGPSNTDELIELRSGLEIFVARMAASRAGPEQIARLAEHLQHMRDSIDDLVEFARADRAFHRELARTAGNSHVIDLLHVTTSLLQVYDDRAVHDAAAAALALAEHEAVFRRVEAADADGAASAMATHMTTAAARVHDESTARRRSKET